MQGRRNATRRGLPWVLAAGLACGPALAQVANGSFESAPNHLAGWTLGPDASVEALQASNFGPNSVTPPDGSWYALVSTGPGNIAAPGGDLDANGSIDHDGSTLSTAFTTTAPGQTLSFHWAFLTDEVGGGGQGQPQSDDLFEVTIDGIPVLRGSVRKPGGSSPFPDTVAYDGLRYTVASSGPTHGSDFGTTATSGRTPLRQACIAIADAGTYTLRFLVADQGDTIHDSGLLFDDVAVGAACDPTVQVTASAGALVEVEDGSFVFTAAENGPPSASDDGRFLAFRSNADLLGDNPGLEPQIWLAAGGGTTYAVTRLTAAVGAEFSDPDLGATGDWVVVASTADLVPGGNADGNREIFRWERAAAAWTQITSTAGCANDRPSVDRDGDRIAFLSDCDFGFGAGDVEVVYWDGTFRGRNTAACVHREPVVSRDAAGRWVSFVTNCDGDYPGTSNADGSFEILQWDTLTDAYVEVTDLPPGTLLEGLDASADGRWLSFVSNGDLDAGQNPAGQGVVFRYDRNGDSFLQWVDPDPLAFWSATALDGSGTHAAAERIDLVQGTFDIVLLDATAPGTLFPVASGAPGVLNGSPEVFVEGGRPGAAFRSDADLAGGNPDGNVELWTAGAIFDPPGQAVYCATPNVAIPDNNNQGVSSTLTIGDPGTIEDLNVEIRVTHSFVGDLRAELRHVDTGTSPRLFDRPGSPPGAGCSGDDIDATVDDEAPSPLEGACTTPGPVAILGPFRPDQPLAALDGQSLAGDWRLTISDRAGGNFGTLVEWCLLPALE